VRGMAKYRVIIKVKEVRGKCPIYKVGDKVFLEWFYIVPEKSCKVCMHAFSAMLTLLSSFIHGVSAKDLGIGDKDDVGYLQCPDPGPPHTCGGTVLFELRRELLE